MLIVLVFPRSPMHGVVSSVETLPASGEAIVLVPLLSVNYLCSTLYPYSFKWRSFSRDQSKCTCRTLRSYKVWSPLAASQNRWYYSCSRQLKIENVFKCSGFVVQKLAGRPATLLYGFEGVLKQWLLRLWWYIRTWSWIDIPEGWSNW